MSEKQEIQAVQGAKPPVVKRETEVRASSCASASSSDRASPPPTQSRPKTIVQLWRKEYTSLFTSAICIIGLSLVLWAQQDKPLLHWEKYSKASVGTIIQFFINTFSTGVAGVLAVCLNQLRWLYYETPKPLANIEKFSDTAGYLGPLQLLWHIGRSDTLVAVGAVLLLAKTVGNIFGQQLVTYPTCDIPAAQGIATEPRTRYYMIAGAGNGGMHLGAALSQLPNGLKTTINLGILGPEFVKISAHKCSSGNCTWGEFHTLGVCGACQDLSSSVKLTNSTVPELLPSGSSSSDTSTSTSTDVASPSGTNTADATSATDGGNPSSSPTAPTDDATVTPRSVLFNNKLHGRENLASWTYSVTDPENPDTSLSANLTDRSGNDSAVLQMDRGLVLASFLRGSPGSPTDNTGYEATDCSKPENTNSWACKGFGAAKCGLQACVRTYKADSKKGTLSETLLDTHILPDSASADSTGAAINPAAADWACLNRKDPNNALLKNEPNSRWINVPTYLESTIELVSSSATVMTVPVDGKNISIPLECVYMWSAADFTSLNTGIETILKGEVLSTAVQGYNPVSAQAAEGSVIMDKIYAGSNISFASISQLYANISDALTIEIRQQGADGWDQPAQGETFKTTTCVHVRWIWLLYPCLTILAMATYLSYVAGRTAHMIQRGETTVGWKGSLLPYLFTGLSDSIRDTHGSPQSLGDMSRIASETRVKLVNTEHGWTFVSEDAGSA